VRDNGIGIPPHLMERMFDDFTQGDGGPDQAGLGLGLGLVKRLVARHGGTVRAASAGEGRGTEVRIRLPEARAGEETPVADDRRLATPPSSTPVSRRVLVVEDNPDTGQMSAILLEKMGHQVRVVPDGPTALAAIREETPEYALIDVGLPGMSGYDLAREIRKLPEARELTLIAHTGYGQAEDRERARAAGFDHHMVKPLDWEALQRVLEDGSASGVRS
jgi:two-component system CheB/CheR fusion protein